MTVALEHPFSKQELIDINLVRIYLQVCKTSDITNAIGDQIAESVWRCLPFMDRRSTLQYPRQLPPTVPQRRVWRKLLRKLLRPNARLPQLHLISPLGPWIAPSTMKWKFSMWDNHLYVQNVTHNTSLGERCVSIHFPCNSTLPNGKHIQLYKVLEPDWFAAHVPKQATPADIHHGTHTVTISTAPTNWSIIRAPSTTFQHHKAHLPPAEKRLLKFVTYLQSDAESKLLHLLTTPQHTIYVGTDGGRKEASGSFAWLICSPDRTKLVCNSGPVDGWAKCQSSYRSELTALSSAMLFLDELTTFFEIDVQCDFQLLVDSTGAISALEHIRDQIPTRHYPDHADVVSTLSDASQILSKSVCQHVKSHQDDTKEYSELSFAAQVNVVCDRMAT